MEFLSRTTGWLNGREAPAPGSMRQLPNIVLLQHHAKEPNQPTRPTPEPKPTPRHAGQGEEQFSNYMSAKGFQTHPGWMGMAEILITLHISCTVITPCCANKATGR